MLTGDTIAAVATAPGRGGVAVVRVSGPDAFAVARRLTGREPRPGRVAVAKFGAVDEGVVLAFRSPRSYTGEDVVEFQCHGGTVTPRRVLEACFAAGARLARRGEFTERAFLNGKIDYDQAESVLDLVDAKTARAADAALEGLVGRKRREDQTLYDEALSISVELEHALDVDEEELPEEFLPNALSRIAGLLVQVQSALRRAREGRILREGALVVLAGPPNAGKSSLMNALLEESRAIVSDIPGTTRDSIEEWMDVEGWPVRLVDTAGLRSAGDVIEAEGVRRAEALIAQADVVICLGRLDGPAELEGKAIVIHAKCDLGRGEGLNVSAKTGEGLDTLRRALVRKLEATFDSPAAAPSSDDHRQSILLEVAALLAPFAQSPNPAANRPIEQSNDSLLLSDPVLIGNAVRTAAERLGALVGATYSADLLDNLFSRFCVGK